MPPRQKNLSRGVSLDYRQRFTSDFTQTRYPGVRLNNGKNEPSPIKLAAQPPVEGISNYRSSTNSRTALANTQNSSVASFKTNKPRLLTRPALSRQSHSKVLHRSAFGPKIVGKTKANLKRSGRSRKPVLLSGLASLMLVLVSVAGFNIWHSDRIPQTQQAVLAESTYKDNDNAEVDRQVTPDETEPDQSSYSNYGVGPDLPRFLKIPKLGVNARVKRIWANQTNELNTPGSIFDAGWYEGSAKPGENGTILLNGHVSGPTKRGIFHSLGNLKPGDTVEVERGNGKILRFKVVKKETYDHDKFKVDEVLKSAEPGKPGLNLITWSGRFDVRTNKYDKKLAVFAVQE